MGTAEKCPVPDRVKPSFVIFDIWALLTVCVIAQRPVVVQRSSIVSCWPCSHWACAIKRLTFHWSCRVAFCLALCASVMRPYSALS